MLINPATYTSDHGSMSYKSAQHLIVKLLSILA